MENWFVGTYDIHSVPKSLMDVLNFVMQGVMNLYVNKVAEMDEKVSCVLPSDDPFLQD